MSSSRTTTDHDEIRRWAEEQGGRPAAAASTGSGDDPGMLRLMFPGSAQSDDDELEEIGWDEWLQAFDENGLALVHDPEGRFNKLVSRSSVRG
jgi:hypothetical protein